MNTEKTWTKSELWAAMCQYDGEFTLAHAKSVLKYFDCGECPGKVGAECDACPIKKAENAIVSNLWEASADFDQSGLINGRDES
jgi:predicted metal-binding protein